MTASAPFDDLAQRTAIIGGIGDDVIGRLALQEGCGLRDVAGLAWRQDEAERPTERGGEQMDFGGQSSSGTPQSLVLVPPFPIAAC